MIEDRKRILAMLAEGKISADEAERLLQALERKVPVGAGGPLRSNGAPKYLRVEVNASEPPEGPAKVNIRVPMNLLRAGVRLGALIPSAARDQVNAAMAKQGVAFDINQLKPENLEALIEQLGELSVDVNNDRAKVRVYCE
jgi:hypothetical protein